MQTLKVNAHVNREQLYDEIIAAVPELAPTPTGPDGRLVARFIIEQVDDTHLLVHLPADDDADANIIADLDTAVVEQVVKDHKRKPEKIHDPVADAHKRVKQRADAGDPLAQDILTLLGQ